MEDTRADHPVEAWDEAWDDDLDDASRRSPDTAVVELLGLKAAEMLGADHAVTGTLRRAAASGSAADMEAVWAAVMALPRDQRAGIVHLFDQLMRAGISRPVPYEETALVVPFGDRPRGDVV